MIEALSAPRVAAIKFGLDSVADELRAAMRWRHRRDAFEYVGREADKHRLPDQFSGHAALIDDIFYPV